MIQKSLLERVRDRIREHGEYNKIDELCLDEIQMEELTPDIKKQIQKCVNLQYLSLNNCGLTSLKNLPAIPKMALLQIQNNKLQDQHITQLSQYAQLTQLSLTSNQIHSQQSLKSLSTCSNLIRLSMENNPAIESKEQDFKAVLSEVFTILPQLEFVNGYNREGNKEEVFSSEEDDEQGWDDEDDEEQSEEEQENQSPGKMRKR